MTKQIKMCYDGIINPLYSFKNCILFINLINKIMLIPLLMVYYRHLLSCLLILLLIKTYINTYFLSLNEKETENMCRKSLFFTMWIVVYFCEIGIYLYYLIVSDKIFLVTLYILFELFKPIIIIFFISYDK